MSTLLDMVRAERALIVAPADAAIAAAEAESRNLTPEESTLVSSLSPRTNEAVRALDERIADLVAHAEATERARRDVPTGGARVTREARTYSPETDRDGSTFLQDVSARFLDPLGESAQRLQRHMTEELVERRNAVNTAQSRAAGTGAFTGLVVPQYLVDMVAPAVAGGRPFANICNKHNLPATGMTVNIGRITTATSAAAQSAENAAVSETNIDDTLLTESIFTVSGQQTLSRQAVERGIGTEDITLNDLMRRYHTALDTKLLNDATTGLTNIAQSVAYTDASPTAAELYPKIINAQANLEGVMLDMLVDDCYAVMHSRRWGWMQSQVGTSWPFLGQPGYDPRVGGANNATKYGSGVRGMLPNSTGVIVDNNIATNLGAGTNEDEIYVVNASELHLWEDPSAPMLIRAEQPAAASLGILLVVYGYAAYSFRRYTNGQQKIAGTGLVTPVFA